MKTYEEACQPIKKDLVDNPYMRYIYENIIGRDDTRIKIANLYNPLLHAQPNKRAAIEVCGKEIEVYVNTLAPNSLNIETTTVATPIAYPSNTVKNDSSNGNTNKKRIGRFIAAAIESMGLTPVKEVKLMDKSFDKFDNGYYYSFTKKPTEEIKTTITCVNEKIAVEQKIVGIQT